MLTKIIIRFGYLLILLALSLFALSWSYDKDIAIPPQVIGRHVQVDDVNLRIYQHGQGRDILYLHGSLGQLEDFETVWPLLKNQYRVTTIDRIGHGYSSLSSHAANIASNAYYAKCLIEVLGLNDVIVVGHSYGGSIALKLAIEHTATVKGYVLIAPAAYALSKTRKLEHVLALPNFGLGLLRLLRPVIAENMLRQGLSHAISPNRQQLPPDFFESRLKLWDNPGILYTRSQQTRFVTAELNAMARFYHMLDVPVTVVMGEKEPFADIKKGVEKFLRTVPLARSITVKNAGHYPHYIQPQAVIDAINITH